MNLNMVVYEVNLEFDVAIAAAYREWLEAHMREMRRRLKTIAEGLAVAAPDRLAGQLAVLINGAFVSMQLFEPGEATGLLRDAAHALIAASRS